MRSRTIKSCGRNKSENVQEGIEAHDADEHCLAHVGDTLFVHFDHYIHPARFTRDCRDDLFGASDCQTACVEGSLRDETVGWGNAKDALHKASDIERSDINGDSLG
jgi:hypothetical protein